MNVFDTIQSMRPSVDPMPTRQRNQIREGIFGVGHDGAASSIHERSESGAVTSTAPRGMSRPVRPRASRSGSLPKVAAGLLVFGAIGAVGWSFANRGEGADVAEEAPVTTPAPTTAAPAPATTEPPLIRTGVSESQPLVLPPELLPVDFVAVEPAAPGASAAIVAAPDGSSLWIAEVDGAESGSFGLEVTRRGSVDVGIDPGRDEDALTQYRPVVPCGFVLVTEGIAQPYDRPSTIQLFEAMSIDRDAHLDINVPRGGSLLDGGPIGSTYTSVFRLNAPAAPVDDDDDDAEEGGLGGDVVTVTQAANGSDAQLGSNGRQLAPIEFFGGPAFVDTTPLDPNITSGFWTDEATAFNVASATLGLAELEAFVAGFEPATVDEWLRRFGTAEPPPVEPIEGTDECTPQPRFGGTLDP